MSTAWRKVVRDFWQERTRTALVVLAIALGIAGFAAVLSSYAVLTRELNDGYLATHPASATLRTDAVDEALVAAVLGNPEVSDAEPRRALSGRIKAGPAEWRNLVVFVIKDFGNIRVSRLAPEHGAWPPATGEILIERDAMQVARARIGDPITIRITGKTPTSAPQTLRVSGTVKDVGQAQARMENSVYGYITLDTLKALGEEPFLDQLKLVVARDRFNERHVQSVIEDVRKVVERSGHPIRRLDIPTPGKHPHADIMGMLLLAMASFGLLVLVLSGILVVNLMSALMASQVRQIGVMQAVGGTRGQIARIYFAQALLLGAAAIVVALPLGIVGSRMLCRALAVFLNFDIHSFAAPAWVALLVAAVGLVAPVLSAAVPVWRGSGVPVRQALAHTGVAAQAFGATRFDRALARVGGGARPLLLAIRNSFRRRTRLVLTVVTVAAGGLFFLSAINVRSSLIHTLDCFFATRRYDLSVQLGPMQPMADVERAVGKTPGVRRAEGWISTEAALVGSDTEPTASRPDATGPHAGGMGGHGGSGSSGGGADRFPVLALPAETELMQMEILQGRGLRAGETDTLVANSALAARFPQFEPGRSVTLRMGPAEVTWRVVGIARESFSPSLAYVPLAFFAQPAMHPGMTNTLRLALERTDAEAIQAVRASLDRNLEEVGIRAMGSSTQAESRYGFDQHMRMIYVFLVVMSCLLGVVGGLGLMTTMSLNVLERRREMGVLRAIGATPAAVWLMVVAEGTVVGVLSWAVAALLAWPVSQAIGGLLVRMLFRSGLDFRFEPLGLWTWLGCSLLLGAVASLVPAWQASRRSVLEAVGYE